MSETLLAICHYFTEETMDLLEQSRIPDDGLMVDLKAIDFPFNVEEFCRQNDAKLAEVRRLREALDITDLRMREIRLYLSHKVATDTTDAVMNLLNSTIERTEAALKNTGAE